MEIQTTETTDDCLLEFEITPTCAFEHLQQQLFSPHFSKGLADDWLGNRAVLKNPNHGLDCLFLGRINDESNGDAG